MSEQAADARITVNIADGVASIKIDNPTQRNALTKEMCLQLEDLVPKLDADPEVTIITLRGVDGAFSAGATINDLHSVLLDRVEGEEALVDHLSGADAALTAATKPTVALVDGACMGGGWQLASACDFIVASKSSVFAITPAKIGIIYPRLGIERLVRQVGHATAKYLLFTGAAFSAAHAKKFGLVIDVIADSEFTERCDLLVDSIKSRSQFSVHAMKRLVDLTDSDSKRIDQEWAEAWNTTVDGPDMTIGIDAFLKRERPQFTWSPKTRSW